MFSVLIFLVTICFICFLFALCLSMFGTKGTIWTVLLLAVLYAITQGNCTEYSGG